MMMNAMLTCSPKNGWFVSARNAGEGEGVGAAAMSCAGRVCGKRTIRADGLYGWGKGKGRGIRPGDRHGRARVVPRCADINSRKELGDAQRQAWPDRLRSNSVPASALRCLHNAEGWAGLGGTRRQQDWQGYLGVRRICHSVTGRTTSKQTCGRSAASKDCTA